jgi:hypothetical protein
MNRREILGSLGMGAVGLAALSGATEADAEAQHPHHHDKAHGDCLKASNECAVVCNETFHYCLGHLKDGHKEHDLAAQMTIDCQEFCKLVAELMARESPMMGLACASCADACKLCAEECTKHDDPQMKECADACKACEALCRAMASHLKDHQHHTG